MVNSIHVEEYLVYPKTSKGHKAMEPLAKKALPTRPRHRGLQCLRATLLRSFENWLCSIGYCRGECLRAICIRKRRLNPTKG
ncbi:hypothetical protein SLA2020_276990 [Shorea laevis]